MNRKFWFAVKLVAGNLGLFFVLLLMSEGLIRLTGKHPIYRRTYPSESSNHSFVHDTNIVRVTWPKEDSTLGWVCRKLERIEFSDKRNNQKPVSYAINEEGFRNFQNFPAAGQKRTRHTIMLLGDSFLFGVYLPDTSTISSLMQKRCGQSTDVFNLGIPGWGIDQMYRCYLKYTMRLQPDIVVLLFIDDDITRVLEAYRTVEGMNKPSYKIESSRLALRVDDRPGIIENIFAHSVLLNPIYRWILRIKSKNIASMIMDELHRKTGLNGQRLLIVRIPRYENYLLPESNESYRLDLSSLSGQVHVIDLYDDIKTWPVDKVQELYLHDGHFSQKGAEFAAEKIFQALDLQ